MNARTSVALGLLVPGVLLWPAVATAQYITPGRPQTPAPCGVMKLNCIVLCGPEVHGEVRGGNLIVGDPERPDHDVGEAAAAQQPWHVAHGQAVGAGDLGGSRRLTVDDFQPGNQGLG